MKNIIKNTSKGFTLIELVMVTIILGILAAVAIPRYQETVDNAEASAEKAFADMVLVLKNTLLRSYLNRS